MAEMLIGAAIGSMWTSIVLYAVVSALGEDLAPTRVQRVICDYETMREYTARMILDVAMSLIPPRDLGWQVQTEPHPTPERVS